MYPTAPAPSARPTTVSVSAYLLYATAALSLIGALISLTTIGTTSDVYKQAYAGTAAQGTESIVVIASVGALVINILFSAGLAILAIFNNRGRQGARITTWALGGVILCCSGIGLAGTAATNTLESSSTAGGPSAREVQERLESALPSWYGPTTTTLSVLMLLALLASLILLALPASNAYFQAVKAMRQGGWDPSMPYPVYPGQQPYAGQPYPGQPYPGYPAQLAPGQQPYPGQQPSTPPPGYGQPGAGEPAPGQPLSPPPSGYGQPGSAEPYTPAPGQPLSPPPSGYGGESSGQQFDGSTPPPTGQQPGGSAESPHTGSIPPADPWDQRPGDHDKPTTQG